MSYIFSSYMRLLEARPILTKSVTSAVIMGGGDVIQQSIEQWPSIKYKLSLTQNVIKPTAQDTVYDTTTLTHNVNTPNISDDDKVVDVSPAYPPVRYDISRMGRMAMFGLFVVGPLCHSWYVVLENVVKYQGLTGAFGKMALDQSLMAPFSTVLFFASMSAMEQKSVDETKQIIKDKTLPTLIINWKIWPIAQMINMYFVPVSLRVLFLNVVGLGYNTILSRIANTKDK